MHWSAIFKVIKEYFYYCIYCLDFFSEGNSKAFGVKTEPGIRCKAKKLWK
ncbi:hypothetical protein SAMN05421821_10124 [Mucilaginibacter lappiensis]|uniref:Uncharacterized protein n=1 Tax=Mucilaginibacter lappiensis TaxID=354630 RepID=A0A1N6N8H7_9SPHI|nr:hypothetical protein [Mucilaginibacter lappiensis]MBB6127846.1 hypothetical protein [Mucilaginibacter lappiensis]SIP88378.1 hypothetical protein SAMN05421821_10124 [Mucilaginibacter lappiensis]